MEAKDTVMKQSQVWDLREAERIRISSCSGFGTRDMTMNWGDKVILEEQAGISFKAGEDKGYENGRVAGYEAGKQEALKSFLDQQQDSHKAGMNEVVNWIGKNSELINEPEETDRVFAECRWLDQLKKWGLIKETVAKEPVREKGATKSSSANFWEKWLRARGNNRLQLVEQLLEPSRNLFSQGLESGIVSLLNSYLEDLTKVHAELHFKTWLKREHPDARYIP